MAPETSTDAVVSLTENAASQVKSMQATQAEHAGKPLRIYIEKGGCSGMQYGMIFDERRENDHCGEWHGVAVVVDEVSAGYLRGAVVDYSDALTGGGFKISNPNARENCGCGKSFQA